MRKFSSPKRRDVAARNNQPVTDDGPLLISFNEKWFQEKKNVSPFCVECVTGEKEYFVDVWKKKGKSALQDGGEWPWAGDEWTFHQACLALQRGPLGWPRQCRRRNTLSPLLLTSYAAYADWKWVRLGERELGWVDFEPRLWESARAEKNRFKLFHKIMCFSWRPSRRFFFFSKSQKTIWRYDINPPFDQVDYHTPINHRSSKTIHHSSSSPGLFAVNYSPGKSRWWFYWPHFACLGCLYRARYRDQAHRRTLFSCCNRAEFVPEGNGKSSPTNLSAGISPFHPSLVLPSVWDFLLSLPPPPPQYSGT